MSFKLEPGLEPAALLAMRAGLTALGALPLGWSRGLGRGSGHLTAGGGTAAFRIICRNLELAFPDRPLAARLDLARRSMQDAGALIGELGLVWQARPAHALAAIRTVRGADLLHGQGGCLVLAPHVGNWELLSLWLAHQGPFTALYDAAGPPRIMAWLRQQRMRGGARLEPIGPGGLRAVIAALRAGEHVGLLPDQVPQRDAGVHVPFFGAPALTMTLVQRLIRRTGARPVFAAAVRVPEGFELRFSPARGLDAADPEQAARALNVGIEDLLRPVLSQYLWAYKRYKRPPPGMADPYRE